MMPHDLSDMSPDAPRVRSALTVLAELHSSLRPRSPLTLLPTGFDALDDVLNGGFRPGELVLVAGKPGVGKTTACLQWARSMARRGVVAVYVCYGHDDITMITRLLACELGEMAGESARSLVGDHDRCARLQGVAVGAITLQRALESDAILAEAQRRLARYADRLVLVAGSELHTDVPAIGEVTCRFDGQPVALFVDYLQKVPLHPAASDDEERVNQITVGLKELALDQRLVTIAVAASGAEGLHARRLHLRHLRGASALAYLADTAVVLNEKLAIVSKSHLANSPQRASEFQRQVVFSVEKNRNGDGDMNLEFEKDFAHSRFMPPGRWVAERLWTEGSIEA